MKRMNWHLDRGQLFKMALKALLASVYVCVTTAVYAHGDDGSGGLSPTTSLCNMQLLARDRTLLSNYARPCSCMFCDSTDYEHQYLLSSCRCRISDVVA